MGLQWACPKWRALILRKVSLLWNCTLSPASLPIQPTLGVLGQIVCHVRQPGASSLGWLTEVEVRTPEHWHGCHNSDPWEGIVLLGIARNCQFRGHISHICPCEDVLSVSHHASECLYRRWPRQRNSFTAHSASTVRRLQLVENKNRRISNMLKFQWWWVVKPLGPQNRELAFLSWCHHITDQWWVLCFGVGKNSVHFFNQAWPSFIQAEKSFSKSSCPRTHWTELALNGPQLTFLSYSAKVLPEGRSKPEGKPHFFGSDRGLSEIGYPLVN